MTKRGTQIDADIIIIGGGPAGMSAALWCSELGMSSILIEKERHFGGQLNRIYNPIENYLGVKCANGAEMLEQFEQSITSRNFERITGIEVTGLDAKEKTVELADGRKLSSRAIILATGVRRRRLNIPGEVEFLDKGILESGSRERESVAGKRVVIIGGGDAAAENALILAEFADRIYIVHRRQKLSARSEFTKQIEAEPKIELIANAVAEEISGHESVKFVTIKNADGSGQKIETDYVLIRVGIEPNTELVRGQADLDERDYVIVDDICRTSVELFYAIGDVANPTSPTIATATGMGATAVKSAFALLKAAKSV